MMPGHHGPPPGSMHQGRRRDDPYQPFYPQQTHSPVHHPSYVAYPQYPVPHPPQYPHPWYPQYHQPPYSMPPHPFRPQGSPVVVSSHPYLQQSIPPMNRQHSMPSPPIVSSRMTPVARNFTPQPTPSTPSATSQGHFSPALLPAPPTQMGASTPTPPPSLPHPIEQAPLSEKTSATVHQPVQEPAAALPPTAHVPPSPPAPSQRMPYYPALPWFSRPNDPFPPRASRRRRNKGPVASTEQGLAFPTRQQTVVAEESDKETVGAAAETVAPEPTESQASTCAPASDIETPATSPTPSEAGSTHPTTPSSALPAPAPPTAPAGHARKATKPVVPLIPIKPVKQPSVASTTPKSVAGEKSEQKEAPAPVESAPEVSKRDEADVPSAPAPKPKSWAELLRSKAAPAPTQSASAANGVVATNGSSLNKSNSLADVLASFSVDADRKVAFLKPRGLVNSGNLCYMNSILQVLLFCVPFYGFLDQVSKRAVHSFKTETPIIDAMVMFMRDFGVIDSAESPEKLRLRLKDGELEQYGEPLAPEYVYDVIKRLPRFDNMKRGQQEDAEEFLGFLLAGLHDECAHVIKSAKRSESSNLTTSPKSTRSGSLDGEWLEVGPKQRAAVTQSSGAIEIESPITKIFGGKLRSEYRRPGEKPSVTLEPYQPLQLDIGSPEIHNITDALKGLTHLETLQGDSPRGTRPSTKQMFIETLPPVLILHLKRFHYDSNGPQKIWKKIGYPLELEIPKEVFTNAKRNALTSRGLPRYRLTAVVYHHGKNASGGHYTVDLSRQDGREWIRMDDTVIRRVRAEDVAEGGAEEDPKILAAALEQHKRDASASRNIYEQIGIDADVEKDSEAGWSQVNGADKQGKEAGGKKWSGVVNGTASPSTTGKRTPIAKENVRDNKVAYILFYEQIKA